LEQEQQIRGEANAAIAEKAGNFKPSNSPTLFVKRGIPSNLDKLSG
jgi:hypothetical protein